MTRQLGMLDTPDGQLITWSCPSCGQPITRVLHAKQRVAVCPHCKKRGQLPPAIAMRLIGAPELPGFETESPQG